MKNDLPEIDVVFDADTIADRIETLATEIADKLPDDVLIVVVLKGFVFAADLLRGLDRAGMRPRVDFITLSSYGNPHRKLRHGGTDPRYFGGREEGAV